MFNLNCTACRLQSQIGSLERSLRNIKLELEKLEKDIPSNYKIKNYRTIQLSNFKGSFHGLCGSHCNNRYDHQFSIKENEIFERMKIVLSYHVENPNNTLNLKPLKESCRGSYSGLYNYIQRIEHAK